MKMLERCVELQQELMMMLERCVELQQELIMMLERCVELQQNAGCSEPSYLVTCR